MDAVVALVFWQTFGVVPVFEGLWYEEPNHPLVVSKPWTDLQIKGEIFPVRECCYNLQGLMHGMTHLLNTTEDEYTFLKKLSCFAFRFELVAGISKTSNSARFVRAFTNFQMAQRIAKLKMKLEYRRTEAGECLGDREDQNLVVEVVQPRNFEGFGKSHQRERMRREK